MQKCQKRIGNGITLLRLFNCEKILTKMAILNIFSKLASPSSNEPYQLKRKQKLGMSSKMSKIERYFSARNQMFDSYDLGVRLLLRSKWKLLPSIRVEPTIGAALLAWSHFRKASKLESGS